MGTTSYYVVVSNGDGCVRVSEPFTVSVINCGSTGYTVTASAGTGGTISPLGTESYSSGDTPTYTITADCGYGVQDVLVNGASVGAVTTYTFTGASGANTIAVTFVSNLGVCQECQDGVVVDLPQNTWYADTDNDGHGDPNSPFTGCVQPDGYVTSSNDCDDTDPLVWLAKPAQIIMNLNPNQVCLQTPPFQLGSAQPEGGTWTGQGVSDGVFSPSAVGLGSFTLTYSIFGDGACVLQASSSATMTVIEDCSAIGINELSENSIVLYPTQSSGKIYVSGKALTKATVRDMSGRTIQAFSLREGEMLDISSFSSGVYLIQVDSKENTEIFKVIKVD